MTLQAIYLTNPLTKAMTAVSNGNGASGEGIGPISHEHCADLTKASATCGDLNIASENPIKKAVPRELTP